MNWDTAEFDIINMTTLEVPASRVFEPLRPGHVIFPEPRNFSSYRQMCEKMGAQISIVKDEYTQKMFVAEISKHPCKQLRKKGFLTRPTCDKMWA